MIWGRSTAQGSSDRQQAVDETKKRAGTNWEEDDEYEAQSGCNQKEAEQSGRKTKNSLGWKALRTCFVGVEVALQVTKTYWNRSLLV